MNGDLVVRPSDSEVVVGRNVRLPCSTSETMEVYWLHIPLGTSQPIHIYYEKKVVNGYSRRYRVEEDTEGGKYDLILQNAQSEDAGTYRCHDRVGSGKWSDAELVVLESEPRCEAQDLIFCNETTGKFNVSCSIVYAGRTQPRISCSSPYTFNSLVMTTEELKNRVNYSIQSTAQWSGTNRISILCQTALSNISSSIEAIAPYAFSSSSTAYVSSNELVECKANSSSNCSYKWIETKTGQITMQQTLKTDSLGKHECISECQLQSQTSACKVKSQTIEVTTQGSDTSVSVTGIIIGIVIVFVVIVICVARIVLIFIHKKRREDATAKEQHQFLN